MPDISEDYKEFEESGTYHHIFELPGNMDREDVEQFIRDNFGPNDENFHLIYEYYQNGEQQYRSTEGYYPDDADLAYDEMSDDADAYGVDSIVSISVTYIGYM